MAVLFSYKIWIKSLFFISHVLAFRLSCLSGRGIQMKTFIELSAFLAVVDQFILYWNLFCFVILFLSKTLTSRLLVTEQSPDCSDCLLRFMER